MSKAERPRASLISRSFSMIAILLAHAVAVCFVLITLCKTVPTYGIFFEQQAVELPVATQTILWLSELCVSFWLPIFVFLITVDAIILAILTLAGSRWILSIYSYSSLLASTAILLYVGAWLSHPVYALVR